jgi:predicted nucleic acid-binding protein
LARSASTSTLSWTCAARRQFYFQVAFAPLYVATVRGSELVASFMTLAGMRQGALDANWGPRKCDVLEACSTWAAVRNETTHKGRPMSSAGASIAATALVLWAPLVTNNPKDYRHLDKLQLVSAAAV